MVDRERVGVEEREILYAERWEVESGNYSVAL